MRIIQFYLGVFILAAVISPVAMAGPVGERFETAQFFSSGEHREEYRRSLKSQLENQISDAKAEAAQPSAAGDHDDIIEEFDYRSSDVVYERIAQCLSNFDGNAEDCVFQLEACLSCCDDKLRRRGVVFAHSCKLRCIEKFQNQCLGGGGDEGDEPGFSTP